MSEFFNFDNMFDASLADAYAAEQLNIAGAPLNVFKLLGVHEQTSLVDLAGNGAAISSGEYTDFPASNAFDNTVSEWRSVQKGPNILTGAYLGYDFGVIKLENARVRYGIDANIRQHITTIKIQQGCNSVNRINKARVERSDDNITWYGVDIITLADSSEEQTINVKQSAPSRFWRLTPLGFNGGVNDFWAVVKMKLIDYASTSLKNVQDELGFLENRDREYATQSILVKGYYDTQETALELSKFGMHIADNHMMIFYVSFSQVVNALGRPLVIGDILEVPSEVQWTPDLKPIRRYVEVTDVAWASKGYTPGFKPILQKITTQPALASQETKDIFKNLNAPSTQNNFVNLNDDRFNVEALHADAKIEAAAKTQLPERGIDAADIRVFTQAELDTAADADIPLNKLQQAPPRALYVEDGLPPNGESYTEGTSFPASPADGAYHRLTYNIPGSDIPPRLYRWSLVKNRWVYLEEDRRYRNRKTKAYVSEFLNDPDKMPANKLEK